MSDHNDDGGDAVRLDPRNLKALAHPLRMRLLGALREYGPATPSMLAERLGESSGSTSYHLRQLAAFGFVEDDPGRPSRKERWWRASHRSTSFDERRFGDDDESALLGAEFLRAVASAHASRLSDWIDGLPDTAGEWRYAGDLSDWSLSLSPAELRALAAELATVVARYGRRDPEAPAPAGTVPVVAQLQLLPSPGAGGRGASGRGGSDGRRC